MTPTLVLAAGATPHRSWLDVAVCFAAILIPFGVIFVATSRIERLHKWMLNDEIYNSGKHLPPGYREYMTRLAPKMGWTFIVAGIAIVLVALAA